MAARMLRKGAALPRRQLQGRSFPWCARQVVRFSARWVSSFLADDETAAGVFVQAMHDAGPRHSTMPLRRPRNGAAAR